MKVRKTELQKALTELQEALAAYSRKPCCSAREKALREALVQLWWGACHVEVEPPRTLSDELSDGDLWAEKKTIRQLLVHTILKLIAKAGLYSPDTYWPEDLKGQLRRIVILAQAALVRTYHADCPRCNKGMQSAAPHRRRIDDDYRG